MSITESRLKEIVKNSVAEILVNQKMLEERERANAPSQEGESHHSMESIADCPTCRKNYKVDEFLNKTIKKDWETRKNLSAKCTNCGYPMKVHGRDGYTEETEDRECPLCHSKDAEDNY
jgi:Zn finger protein HypA/HybF involved in hydrogenase expression